MNIDQGAGLAGGGIEGEEPAVFVVGGAGGDDGPGSVFAPDGRAQLEIALLRAGGLLLAVIHPLHFAGLHVEDGEAGSALAVADVGAAGDVLGVGAVGDEVGDDGVFGGRGGRFEDAGDDVLFVGRELEVAHGLARLESERLAGGILRTLLLLLFAEFDALADYLEELLLFFLEVLLTFGAARFGSCGIAGRGCGAASTAALASAAPEASLSTTAGRGRSAGGGRGGAADVGELDELAVIERHHVEVAAAGEGDAFSVLGEAGIGFGVGGFGELNDFAGGVVEGIEVAGAGIDHEALVFGGFAERGRQQADLFVGEFAQGTAVAVDGVGVHGRNFLVGAALPLEEDAGGVVRPADGGGFVADEGGSAHDVVDGQGEVVRRTGLEDKKPQDKENDECGEGYLAH